MGKTYVEDAFKFARKADPEAQLFYNDYNIVSTNKGKRDAIYDMAKDFKNRGVPIDGIGMQMHVGLDISTDLVDEAIKKFGSLGLKVHITELDVKCPNCHSGNTSELNKQADVYRNVVQACLQNKGVCEAVLTWGFSDRYTWLGSDKYPLPFDY